ncbi:MAG: bifunctional glutamate N-acetyltransferase/amino-acid acetyltransferase ArgJ [Candidatus Auribacter fodinae]|uniref:Arginine biosynthesis bifunctional protein ArgJ n=1 Tax=Candidatus Auribacter fodinae TaxID=2093366 RepID=A0A3A4R7B9_9BACT|nr:MAG: bifunctional glutamate N-acetyltransferase/amino-acid acetyltransferase ArgJ [Candidatus Auribacter fodinae]
MEWINGGITAPEGFRAAGIGCGIKFDKPDLAVVVSDRDALCAGCFTRNKVKAAPVRVCKDHLSKTNICRAFIVSSGIANACTGEQGIENARRMASLTAEQLGVKTENVMVCSTGRIGTQLPLDKIAKGIVTVVGSASKDGAHDAAVAIMTTDVVPKEASCSTIINGSKITFGGMVKGAGMIAPDMATMLAFITTDAAVEPVFLQTVLRECVDKTFNSITVDGDTSTNDTVLMMANGVAGNPVITAGSEGAEMFRQALQGVCYSLAEQIVRDGEGATKLIQVTVTGAVDNASARKASHCVANSLLLKVAFSGPDANWGRIMAALGRAGIEVDPDKIDVFIGDVPMVARGVEIAGNKNDARQVWKQQTFVITVDLHLGPGKDTCLTCDISHAYIDINL